jgi:disulfide bond formation protein DsbB
MRTKTYLLLTLFVLLGAMVIAACGSSTPAPTPTPTEPQGDPVAGKTSFGSTCASCHGQDAKGMPGLGKDLTVSEFVASNTNAELVAFIKTGRPANDPLNTVGVDMPPKGGNPALNDQDILNIVAYVRSIHQ